jgi:hypothetical protein
MEYSQPVLKNMDAIVGAVAGFQEFAAAMGPRHADQPGDAKLSKMSRRPISTSVSAIPRSTASKGLRSRAKRADTRRVERISASLLRRPWFWD